MKGRSQQQQCRMPAPTTATEDWVDGSWTVDCSCGVTFDDGEEMVSCDDCGVWVHTRCARFVRGRDASFVCHNCKAAARRLRSADDQLVEESEVAQLLLDMPNQADNPPPLPRPPAGGGQPPPSRPRFWTEIPLEDRVHVQGVPGGDPGFFRGLSSVFDCQLWRCTGYVPKKFRFRYKEFPCWDDEEVDHGNVEEEKTEEKKDGDNSAASKGANMLFSLSNNVFPPYASEGKLEDKKGTDDDKVSSGGSGRSMNSGKKERNKIRAVGHHSVKRKKDDMGEGKERSGKNKRPRSDADSATVDNKKRGISFLPGTKSSEIHKSRNSQARNSVVTSVKTQHQKEENLAYSNYSSVQQDVRCNSDERKSLVYNKDCVDASSQVGAKENGMKEICLKDENVVQAIKPEISPAVDEVTQGEGIYLADDSHMDEAENPSGCCLQQFKAESNFVMDLTKGSCHSVPVLDNLGPASHDHMNTNSKIPGDQLPDSQDTKPTPTKFDDTEDMIDQQVDQSTENSKFHGFPDSGGKINDSTIEPVRGPSFQLSDVRKDLNDHTCVLSYESKCREAKRQSNDSIHKRNEVERGMPSGTSKAEELVAEPSVGKDSLGLRKNSDEHLNLELQDPKKLPSDMLRSEADVMKNSSASFSPIISKSSVSVTSPGIVSSSLSNDNLLSKRDKVSTCTSANKESLEAAICAEGTTGEASKEPEKGYLSSRSKSSPTTKISYLSTSKRVIPGAKEPSPSRLSRASTKEDALAHLGSLDGSGSSVHVKAVSTKFPKNEKIHHSVPYPTSKSLHSSSPLHMSQSVNASTTLSDEELALLLHQELNSSPRVPRVPRVRQGAGMQSATTSSMSMLSRRSSVPSGKDQNLVFRRKSKDDRWRGHSRDRHDSNDVSRRKHRMPSPDHQYHKSSFVKKDRHNRSTDALLPLKKNNSVTSAESTSSEPSSSEASGRSSHLFHGSPKEVPKEDANQTPRTLPGLIDEIMSKDGHKTYEELCDAVRLHWDDLRKPNGERYAYASHVHAVHDCLRNRSEWAHLIDQVPKTTSSKRRRKVESELPKVESENRRAKIRANKMEENSVDSHREDYPKGKRKARKRRLEILGKGFKDSRNKQIEDAASDEDHTAFSQSSHEGNDSSDDSQDTGSDEEGTDLSSSSSDDSD